MENYYACTHIKNDGEMLSRIKDEKYECKCRDEISAVTT